MVRLGWLGLLGLAACDVDGVGFPVDTGADGADLWEAGAVPEGCAVEHEPNDLESDDGTDYDWAGLLHADRPVAYCGRLSATGVRNDGTYKGDLDHVFVELASSERVHASVWVEAGGQVDLHVMDPDGTWDASYGGGPWSGRLGEGFPLFVVVSPGGPQVDYQLELWVD